MSPRMTNRVSSYGQPGAGGRRLAGGPGPAIPDSCQYCGMHFVIRAVVTAVALAVATWLVPGIVLESDSTVKRVLTLLAVAVIVGIVNAIIKPIVKVVGCVFYVLTLGLIGLVVNGLLLWLSSWVAGKLNAAVPHHRLLARVLGRDHHRRGGLAVRPVHRQRPPPGGVNPARARSRSARHGLQELQPVTAGVLAVEPAHPGEIMILEHRIARRPQPGRPVVEAGDQQPGCALRAGRNSSSTPRCSSMP